MNITFINRSKTVTINQEKVALFLKRHHVNADVTIEIDDTSHFIDTHGTPEEVILVMAFGMTNMTLGKYDYRNRWIGINTDLASHPLPTDEQEADNFLNKMEDTLLEELGHVVLFEHWYTRWPLNFLQNMILFGIFPVICIMLLFNGKKAFDLGHAANPHEWAVDFWMNRVEEEQFIELL